jgi:hypothetical protein
MKNHSQDLGFQKTQTKFYLRLLTGKENKLERGKPRREKQPSAWSKGVFEKRRRAAARKAPRGIWKVLEPSFEDSIHHPLT